MMRLGSLALVGLVLFGGAAWAATGDPLVVTGDGVNVRFDPSTGSRIVMQVYRNQQVVELERQGAWVRAEIAGTNGVEGWIHGSLLAPPGGEALAPPPDAKPEPKAASAAPAMSVEPAPELRQQPAQPTVTPEAAKPETATSETTGEPETATSEPETATSETTGEEPTGVLAATPSAETESGRGSMPEPAAGPAAGALAGLAQFRESVDYLNQRAQDLAGVDLFSDVESAGEGVVQVVAAEGWSTVTPAGQQSFLNTLLARWAAAKGGTGPARVQIVDPSGRVVMEKSGP